MTTREELDIFLVRAEELIQSNYILADVKIVGLLKAIASSKTILAIFENCLSGFDYEQAKTKYLVKSSFLSEDKGEFILPSTTRELLAFSFYILVDIDNKKLDLSSFINKYFYEDGSSSAGYTSFIKGIIIPLKDAVKTLTESVLEGKLQNPLEALKEEEERREKEREIQNKIEQEESELNKKSYAENVKKIKELLLTDKLKIKASNYKEKEKQENLLIVDMLGNVISSDDKDAIEYAFLAYKYMAKTYPFRYKRHARKISKLLVGVYNGI